MQNKLPLRTHYFSMAISKHVFIHRRYGVVFVDDAMQCNEARSYGLSPLLLYALAIPNTSIRLMKFTHLDRPAGIYDTLRAMWANEESSFRGCPEALVVGRSLAEASPELGFRLAHDGIQLVVAGQQVKTSAALLRSAQEKAKELSSPRGEKAGLNNIDDLNNAAEAVASYKSSFPISNLIYRANMELWSLLPYRSLPSATGREGVDWSSGPWLNSWETNLPPTSLPRYFHKSDYDNTVWLLFNRGEGVPGDAVQPGAPPSSYEARSVDEYITINLAKDLLACWPNTMRQIAQSIGTTVQRLNWFLRDKATLDRRMISTLRNILGIEICHETGEYEAAGPCTLIAKDVSAACNLYDEMSHGGDLEFSFEAVPESGLPDASWRYVVFQSWGGYANIMMFERGSKASARLDDNYFINFQGIRTLPSKIYRDVVNTAARASMMPDSNRTEMLAFVRRQSLALSQAGGAL